MKPEKLEKLKKREKPEEVFRKDYADAYDLLYTDKDYEAECDIIEEVFRCSGNGSIRTILDLGCGTGNHVIPLAQRGYEVTGVDISPDMLRIARSKSDNFFGSVSTKQTRETKQTKETRKTRQTRETRKTAVISPVFIQGDVRSLDLGKNFDAVLMMFAVLGYQTTNDDLMATLRTVRRHLKAGGLFVFDVWYGPAVLTIRPSERVKVIPTAEDKIIRATSGDLDTFRHTCEVHYHVWQINGKTVVNETEEKHTMRYFFPQELSFLLSQSNLNLLDIFDFQEIGRVPTVQDWNVLCIGRG
ncbi:MAG: class I SAM-dependent methyltransferase [Thermodesulfobacteriota bacterium]